VWNDLCDWAIEMAKPTLYGEAEAAKADDGAARRRLATQGALATALETAMRLMHPFMPFISEEICQSLPRVSGSPDSLVITMFPVPDDRYLNDPIERKMAALQAVVGELRNVRARWDVPAAARPPAVVAGGDAEVRAAIAEQSALVSELAHVGAVEVAEARPSGKGLALGGVGGTDVVLRLEGVVDLAARRGGFERDLAKRGAEIEKLEKRLGDAAFVERAPADVVERDRARVDELRTEVERLRGVIEGLSA
jgi:valyl-tRNA synthetase